MNARTDDELVPVPASGRCYGMEMFPGLADCAPSGRMRLDAIARWLQDAAWSDVEDAGVTDRAVWILRRTRIQVNRFPHIAERCLVRTFCSGIGRLVAERRTVISPLTHPDQHDVETVAVWVHLDPNTRRPSGLSPEEHAIFATSGYGDRDVGHRLRHPRPVPGNETLMFDWQFRRVDTDLADHVNNAAYWELLEEELLDSAATLAAPAELATLDVEIEFRDGAQPGPVRYVRDTPLTRAILDPGGGLIATVALRDPHSETSSGSGWGG
jgi:acyl-ACP thioesterase